MNKQTNRSSNSDNPNYTLKVVLLIVLLLAAVGLLYSYSLLGSHIQDDLAEERETLLKAVNTINETNQVKLLNAVEKELLNGLQDQPRSQPRLLLLYAALSLRTSVSDSYTDAERTQLIRLSQSISVQIQSDADLLAAGHALLLANQTSAYNLILEELRQRNIQSPEFTLLIARSHLLSGDTKKALSLSNSLIEKNAENFNAWILLSQALKRQNSILPLCEAYRKIIDLQPGHSTEFRIQYIQELTTLGEGELARNQYNELSIEAKKSLEQSHPLLLIKLLRLEGNDEEALQKLNTLLASVQNDEALILRAQMFIANKQNKLAFQDLLKAINSQPYNERAHYLLGQLYLSEGNQEQGTSHLKIHQNIKISRLNIPHLEKYLSQNPNDKDKLGQLRDMYQALGRINESLQIEEILRSIE